ncbi:MAG: hypothetical protein RJQ09_01390 [Cyclobacteriaceae bacterium]
MSWKPLKIRDFESLNEAREQLHQASQIPAAVGRFYSEKVKDDHFANFTWNAELNLLQGHLVGQDFHVRAALRMEDLTLVLLNEVDVEIGTFPLDAKTQTQALIWLEEYFEAKGMETTGFQINRPYEIPKYPQQSGGKFELQNPELFAELAAYFHNTNHVVWQVIKNEANASEINCWPHHFDIASLLTLSDTGDPETSISIGVGFSPGDEQYQEPYFYLTPWPYPDVAELPEGFGPGKWHTDGWVGAVLTATEMMESNNSPQQAVLSFYNNGLDILKKILKPS